MYKRYKYLSTLYESKVLEAAASKQPEEYLWTAKGIFIAASNSYQPLTKMPSTGDWGPLGLANGWFWNDTAKGFTSTNEVIAPKITKVPIKFPYIITANNYSFNDTDIVLEAYSNGYYTSTNIVAKNNDIKKIYTMLNKFTGWRKTYLQVITKDLNVENYNQYTEIDYNYAFKTSNATRQQGGSSQNVPQVLGAYVAENPM